MTDDYKDIIGLPYPRPGKRNKMSMEARAAQFAPFAALTGYDEAIDETVRATEKWIEIDEEKQRILNQKIANIEEHINERKTVSMIIFVPDERKEGGKYIKYEGIVKMIDNCNNTIIFANGDEIEISRIADIS